LAGLKEGLRNIGKELVASKKAGLRKEVKARRKAEEIGGTN